MQGAGEPRWLNEDEQQQWRAFIDAVRLCLSEIDRELQHDSGLNHAYYQILVALSEAPDRTMRMSELATLTLTSRSRLSHAVNRLEEAGWVARHSCASDRRGAYAVLTDRGYATLEAAARGHVEAVRRNLFDILSPAQMQQLGEISAVLRDSLNAGTLACRQAEAECAEADAESVQGGCAEADAESVQGGCAEAGADADAGADACSGAERESGVGGYAGEHASHS